jgi:uncharacterized repeat protein (TIGR01451 family)
VTAQSQPASPDPGKAHEVRTGRWRGVEALALAAAALGILQGAPLVVLTGLAGVAFAAYSRLWHAPEPTLSVRRSVSDPDPDPGQTVTVTLAVRNEGDRLLPDLRLVDDVPAGLAVVDGTPRHTTALRPGKTATIAYEVEAVRGRHAFDSLTVVSRDLSGSARRVDCLPTEETTVTCRPAYGEQAPGSGRLATLLAGPTPVSAVGSGTEFHSLREYRRGDPLGSLDWGRLAKTGDLATRRYDEPRTVKVVLLVDARRAAYVAPDDRRRPAVDICTHAAGELAGGLADAGTHVGLAALSPRECWLPPGDGAAHHRRLRDLLTCDEAFGWEPPTEGTTPEIGRHTPQGPATATRPELPAGADTASERRAVPDGGTRQAADGRDGEADEVRAAAREALSTLHTRLSPNTQVVFLTPLSDATAGAVARRLDAVGHDVTVASPDVTATDTPARRLAAVERRLRVERLRRDGLTVAEWTPSGDPTDPSGWSP